MPHPTAPAAPAPALFDVTSTAAAVPAGALVRVALADLELAPNARRQVDPEGIDRLAEMLMRAGQLVPCIGHRPDPGQDRVVLYAGQRRLLAARRSAELARDGLTAVRGLIVTLLDHEPTADEIRRIQAQENQREDLTLADQQAQFADCWAARAGLTERERIATVCADLGIGTLRAHNLRRQLTLPEPIRARVAERPTERQLSVTLANRLADLHDVSPPLAAAVAQRISSPELHDAALRDLGAFVHRTVVEDEAVYAVRIDDGALLDAGAQLTRAREHLSAEQDPQLANVLGCAPDELERELTALQRAATGARLRVDQALRERARTGRYAVVHDRGRDFAAGIWVIDPVFMIDAVRQAVAETPEAPPAREARFFAGAGLDAPDLRAAAAADRERRHDQRQRQIDAVRSNLGLGQDLRAGLLDPTRQQLDAVRVVVCHLLARDYRDVIAYGAGWSDPERQRPVGETARHEPQGVETVIAAELERALAEPDPLRGVTALLARFAAAFVLDGEGVTRTKLLGSERMARRLDEAVPSSDSALREALWTLLRPMLSPRLAELHRDAFTHHEPDASTVDLNTHRADSSLAELELGEDTTA